MRGGGDQPTRSKTRVTSENSILAFVKIKYSKVQDYVIYLFYEDLTVKV